MLPGRNPVNPEGASNNERIRGRPSSAIVEQLIREGSTSDNTNKCSKCGRVFTGKKNLKVHLLTHSENKPHGCTYPNCNKGFSQLVQLRTHERLHTSEKPYICPVEDCKKQFTHANRKCGEHPNEKLNRSKNSVMPPISEYTNLTEEEIDWHVRYRELRQKNSNKDLSTNLNENQEDLNRTMQIERSNPTETESDNETGSINQLERTGTKVSLPQGKVLQQILESTKNLKADDKGTSNAKVIYEEKRIIINKPSTSKASSTTSLYSLETLSNTYPSCSKAKGSHNLKQIKENINPEGEQNYTKSEVTSIPESIPSTSKSIKYNMTEEKNIRLGKKRNRQTVKKENDGNAKLPLRKYSEKEKEVAIILLELAERILREEKRILKALKKN